MSNVINWSYSISEKNKQRNRRIIRIVNGLMVAVVVICIYLLIIVRVSVRDLFGQAIVMAILFGLKYIYTKRNQTCEESYVMDDSGIKISNPITGEVKNHNWSEFESFKEFAREQQDQGEVVIITLNPKKEQQFEPVKVNSMGIDIFMKVEYFNRVYRFLKNKLKEQ